MDYHTEDIFGIEPINLVIRHSLSRNKTSNDCTVISSIKEIQLHLTTTTVDCYFQNLDRAKQKIILPVASQNFQIELIVLWHPKTRTYKIPTKPNFQPRIKHPIQIPTADYLYETCSITFVDLDEYAPSSDELFNLYQKIEALDCPTEIDIEKESKIWFKYIDATQKLIEKKQQPFAIKQYHPIQPIGSNMDRATKFKFKVDLNIEINKEYKEIEQKLKELDVEQPKFDLEGNIRLTLDDIFKALDPVLEQEFQDTVVRKKAIGCIVKIAPISLLHQLRADLEQLNWNVQVQDNVDKKELYFFNSNNNSKTILLPKEIMEQYQLQRKGFYAKFRLKDIDDKIHVEELRIDVDKALYGRWLENEKKAFFQQIVTARKQFYENGYTGVNKPNLCEVYTYSTEMKPYVSGEFEQQLKRHLYQLPFEITYNKPSQTLFFEFESKFVLQQRIKALENNDFFSLKYQPKGFKYKASTTIVAHKTHLQTVEEKIEKLAGVDFEIVIPQQKQDTNAWFFPDTKRPPKLLLGTLSRKESNTNSLVFVLNTYYKEHKQALQTLSDLLKKGVPIQEVYPNLIGEATKIKWLKQAIRKLTKPNDKLNGKPINPKLKDFIFDSSKATPIYDTTKLAKDSDYWQTLKKHSLSNTLNDSQIRAVLSAVYSTDLCLLQGPPGTGKTTVISEIIWQQILQKADQPHSYKILLTSETNLAVDNALERLINENTTIVKPLRFGNSARLEEEGKKYSRDRIMKWAEKNTKTTPHDKHGLIDIELEEHVAEDLSNNAVQKWMLSIGNRAHKRATAKYADVLKQWHQDLALPSTEIKVLFRDKYFKYINVIGSTCSSCGSPKFKQEYDKLFDSKQVSIHFDTVIMDEASKATPPEMVLPLCFGQKSIIIGDHKQLPPMINDREFREVLIEEAEEEELAKEISQHYLKESQFKRLIVNSKVSSTIRATFDVQYRMHSQIGSLIQQFYPELENGLVCGIKAQENAKDLNNKASRYHGFYHKGFIQPHQHVIWVDVPAPEAKDGTSRVNEQEVQTVKQVLNYLDRADGFKAFQQHWNNETDADKRLQEQEIGIISFYGKQVRKLNEVRKYAQKELGMNIRLKTVDKFQGMERNIIIVSTVRSNQIIDPATGQAVPNRKNRRYSPWGFADSPERLNVALSRARRLLIIVGNRQHFEDFKNKEGVAIYKNVIHQIPAENIIDYKTLKQYL
ncbi:MAG: AAA domain-containing protein [Aureispira sp.]